MVKLKKKLLELFCGTKSVSKALSEEEFEVISLDIDPDFEPTICADFMDWDYTMVEAVDYLWASPDCACYSMASGGTHFGSDKLPKTEKAVKSLAILQKLRQCIDHFQQLNPNLIYFIENPRARMRWFLTDFERYTFTYCQFGFDRMKPTDIWSNQCGIESICCKNGDSCHIRAPRGSYSSTQGLSKMEKYLVPRGLVRYLFKCDPN